MWWLQCSTLLGKSQWRAWDAGCLATVSLVLTVKPRSPRPSPKHGLRPPVTRLSASLADGLEVVSIDSMLNRHRPAEINHTCLLAGQNMVSQNAYEFSYSRKYRQVSCKWIGWIESLTERFCLCDSLKLLVASPFPPLLGFGPRVPRVMIDTNVLGQNFSRQFSFLTSYHFTYIHIHSSVVPELTNWSVRVRSSKRRIFSPNKTQE